MKPASNMLPGKIALLLMPLLLGLAPTAQAVDLNWSGFGTLGAAVSDQSYKYQRFINDEASFNRDSLFGIQLDARLSQQWSATIQGKVAASDHHDSAWQPSLTWAFVSWRPSDDWLIRAGKIRLPLMLNTENLDVGGTFDMARLPQEVYSIAPTNDVVGLSISRSWTLRATDWNLEAYSGQANTYQRYYGRVMTPESKTIPGSFFLPFRMISSGLVLAVRGADNIFRIGVHNVSAKRKDGQSHGEIPYVQGPGFGYYNIEAGASVDELTIPVQTLGMSLLLPADVRVTAEYARMEIHSSSEGLARWGAYIAASKRFGDWVPYVYLAKMKSAGSALAKYRDIERSAAQAPTPFLRTLQILGADAVAASDQWTGGIGTSYRLSSNGLLKAEWSQTHTGVVSSFVDAPPGEESGDRRINVYSLSYSVIF